jgi:hypothetical protein
MFVFIPNIKSSGPLSSCNFQRTQTDEVGWRQKPVWTRWRVSSASAGITTQAVQSVTLYPFAIQFFCQPHTPQLLFVLGGKEVGGLLVIILVLKEKIMEKHKEYNLRHLLAKVRTT